MEKGEIWERGNGEREEYERRICGREGHGEGGRDTKSPNFPVGRISRAKTFRTKRVNRFREKNAPKVRK